uniref:Uncharacterized protein n=1 Tax=Cucumis melo TaxID=3656 RepID=A0A9I9CCA1_CUCME
LTAIPPPLPSVFSARPSVVQRLGQSSWFFVVQPNAASICASVHCQLLQFVCRPPKPRKLSTAAEAIMPSSL